MSIKNNPISQLIAREIASRGIDYREAATYFRVSHQCVNQWARGETKPSDKTLLTLIQSKYPWVSDLAFRCLIIRYPAIVQLIALRSQGAAAQETPHEN